MWIFQKNGSALPSLVSRNLEGRDTGDITEEENDLIMWSAGGLYGGKVQFVFLSRLEISPRLYYGRWLTQRNFAYFQITSYSQLTLLYRQLLSLCPSSCP